MNQNVFNQNYKDYNSKKKNGPQDNYYGKIQRDYGQQIDNNIYINNQNDNKFQNTKNKIKVIIYKNGFVLNNGPFRDRSIPENLKFMEEVEKGVIPHELMKKGINDLGILLENRKNEVYKKKHMNPITTTLNNYIYGNLDINNINPNPNINNNYNIPEGMNPIIDPNVKIHPPIILKPGEDIPIEFQQQDPYLIQSQKYNKNKYNSGKSGKPKVNIDNLSLTPIEGRNERRNLFEEKNSIEENYPLQKRESLSAPKKKEEKKFKTFASLIREEKEKEEEEKKKKAAQKQQNPNQIKVEKKEEEEEKKFQAFTGTGQLIGNVNMQGLHVQKDIKNVVDRNKPICTFSVRLFNGEVIKCEFNHTQTLREVYFYIQKISGSNNFYLLDGFPPKPLRDYNRPIGEFNLENSILTQKIK